jgi:hypothetical protein
VLDKCADNPSAKAFFAFAKKYGFGNLFQISANGRADQHEWKADRCGLYIWLAANGEVYLGQSVDVRRRLIEHQKGHLDIIIAAFIPVDRQELDAEEARLARLFEAVGPVRNVKLVTKTYAVVPYDLAVKEPCRSPRPMPEQAIRAAKNYRLFCEDKQAQEMMRLLRHFASNAVPNIWATEGAFWSASVFAKGWVRLNCGQQEIFTCWPADNGQLQIRILCDSSLDWQFNKPRLYKTRSYEHHWSPKKFLAFTDWQKLRDFSEYLMRHTTALNSTNHCPQLFREFLGE